MLGEAAQRALRRLSFAIAQRSASAIRDIWVSTELCDRSAYTKNATSRLNRR